MTEYCLLKSRKANKHLLGNTSFLITSYIITLSSICIESYAIQNILNSLYKNYTYFSMKSQFGCKLTLIKLKSHALED